MPSEVHGVDRFRWFHIASSKFSVSSVNAARQQGQAFGQVDKERVMLRALFSAAVITTGLLFLGAAQSSASPSNGSLLARATRCDQIVDVVGERVQSELGDGVS
jgi:hypothetical protein